MLGLVWLTYGCGWCGLVSVNDHALVGTTGIIVMICVVDLCKVWAYLSIYELMWKYVLFQCMFGNHVEYDCVLVYV